MPWPRPPRRVQWSRDEDGYGLEELRERWRAWVTREMGRRLSSGMMRLLMTRRRRAAGSDGTNSLGPFGS